MSLPSWPLCHSMTTSWSHRSHCWILSIIMILPYQVFNVLLSVRCSPGLRSRSHYLYHVHHLNQYSHLHSFPQPPPLRRWLSTLFLLSPNQLWPEHYSPSKRPSAHLSKQLAKLQNSSLNTTHTARNLGFIFDEHLHFSDQISPLSKFWYYHTCQLHCICFLLISNTVSAIAASIVNSKLDYYNSLS